MRKRVVSTAVVTAALTLTLGLTGCTSVSAGEACVPTLSSGALTNSVKDVGGFDTEPTITLPKQITIGGAQTRTIERATDRSRAIEQDAVLTVNYALYEDANGTILEGSNTFTTGRGSDFLPFTEGVSQGSFLNALECAAPGDRLVVAFDPAESTAIAGSVGLAEGTNIIALVDVHDVVPLHLQGRVKNLPSGFPGVITNEDGQPGVVVAPGKAPTEFKAAPRIEGPGTTVKASDGVVANFMKVSWTGELEVNTRADGGPSFVGTAEQPINEVREMLTGATVGSQMVYLVPDAAGSASIYVVDILAAG